MNTASVMDKGFKEFVMQFHQTMVEKKLTLVYEGEVNQSITKAFVAMAERNMDETEQDLAVKKRVYHVMVECLQNICKHADDMETGAPDIPGSGIILVSEDKEEYTVTTGNVIANERMETILEILQEVNTLDRSELKELYKKQIKESRLSLKGGAGLGFIDIAKKTGNGLVYHFEPLNDITSFFILKTTISKNQ